jgi:hypothetical protein
MMSETQDVSWPKENLIEAAELLEQNDAWIADSSGPLNAVATQYATATRTICRDESLPDSDSAGDWYISATSSATPGAANNPKRHEVK